MPSVVAAVSVQLSYCMNMLLSDRTFVVYSVFSGPEFLRLHHIDIIYGYTLGLHLGLHLYSCDGSSYHSVT